MIEFVVKVYDIHVINYELTEEVMKRLNNINMNNNYHATSDLKVPEKCPYTFYMIFSFTNLLRG